MKSTMSDTTSAPFAGPLDEAPGQISAMRRQCMIALMALLVIVNVGDHQIRFAYLLGLGRKRKVSRCRW